MDRMLARVIPFPCPRAPRCDCCGGRMGLIRSQPDPNGGRYMFEMFGCEPCRANSLKVRPVRPATAARVYPFARLRRVRPTG
jgi:hypothetical protein